MLDEEMQNLAAEYALGSLDAEARARAEALCAVDVEFARSVEEWEGRLAPLGEALAPQAPPATVWKRIEGAVKLAGTIPSISPGPQLSELRERLSLWRTIATGAMAATIVLALVATKAIAPSWAPSWAPGWFSAHDESHYVAMLMDDGGQYGFIITVATENEQIMIRKVAEGAPSSKLHELWLIKPDGSTPASLGILDEETLMMVDVSGKVPMDDFVDGVKLAISVEPSGGASSGNNMGPVVFAGLLMKQMP